MQQSYIRVKAGKMLDKAHLTDVFLNLQDGEYVITVENITDKTIETYRRKYFAMVDIVSNYTGTAKNEIHFDFKAHNETKSTKTFTIEDWILFIKTFRKYVFDNLDILL